MNEIKQTTNDIFSLTLSALFAFIIAPTAYVGYLYFNYIKMAIVGLGVMGIGLAGLAIGSVAIGLIGGLVYRGADAWLKIQAKRVELDLANADVAYRKAESVALLQQVTAIKPGHHAVITHANHPLQVVSYAVPQLALPDKVATVAQLSTPSEVDMVGGIRMGNDWIKDVLFDEYANLKIHHVKVDGPTGVGKTHLILNLMWLLQQPHPAAEYWLLDPKFEGKESGWPFEPFVTNFDNMAIGAEYLYEHVVLARRAAKVSGVKPTHPAFFIFDEVDGSFDEHGDKFTKPVRRIIKEARSVWGVAFLSGQSPLVKENGFSGAILRNTARFVLGAYEAMAFVRNPQFNFNEDKFKKNLLNQIAYQQANGKRSALVIPPSGQGMPFVGEIPHMGKPNFNQAAPVSEASKLILSLPPVTGHVMDLSSIPAMVDEKLSEMIAAYNSGKTITEVAAIGYSSAGDKQNVSCLVKLQANGVQLRSEHLAKLAKVRG